MPHCKGRKTALLLIFCVIFTLLASGCSVLWEPAPTANPELLNTPEGQRIDAFARENGFAFTDYPESLVRLLIKNPETEDFVLEYPMKHSLTPSVDISHYSTDRVPLFLQWDPQWGYLPYGSDLAGLTACGPVCLSMAAYYLTGDPNMSPDRIIEFSINNGYCVPGDGTSWTLISEGGELLGLDVTEIPLDKERVFRNLEVRNPIICIMGPGDFTDSGHFIVMAGCEDGLIRINDPNSRLNSEKLWRFEDIQDQIRNLWVIR